MAQNSWDLSVVIVDTECRYVGVSATASFGGIPVTPIPFRPRADSPETVTFLFCLLQQLCVMRIKRMRMGKRGIRDGAQQAVESRRKNP